MSIPFFHTSDELADFVCEIGFLPLLPCSLPGFSVYEHTDESVWFSGDAERCPWEWRYRLAEDERLAYGKFFRGKAGYLSREALPLFANWRRDGYDFDALYEDGKATRKAQLLMQCFPGDERLASWQLRELAGFGKGGEKGFEGAVTGLQMQCYLVVCGFARKRNRAGEEYGWPTSVFMTPEARYGAEHVTSAYAQPPHESLERLCDRCAAYLPDAPRSAIEKLLK
jgi:hypothetical protein